MNGNHVDRVSRWLDVAQSRRVSLGHGLAVLAAQGLALGDAKVSARKKKHKKKCKVQSPEPPTCLESCHAPCTACFTRKEGSLLCGEIQGVLLAPCGDPCSTDNDCVGTGFPYCILGMEERATGDVTEFVVCQNVPGRCTAIPGCTP